jgi:hypothetical protein
MPANNYVKLAVHLDANEGDDGLALGFARKCKKLAEVAPDQQYRNGGSFSWVFPFTGDGSGQLPEAIETEFGAVRAELASIVTAGEIRESVWRSKDAQGLDVIGKFYDT